MSGADMIERVARAICTSEGMDPDEVNGLLIINRPGERPNWEGFEDTARAAIEAMREPTEAMVNSGILVCSRGICADDPTSLIVAATHAAMIDAALKREGE